LTEIVIITPIPKAIDTLVESSILRKALEKKVVKLKVLNLRDFGIGSYKKIDDKPYGGLHGMVLMAEPLSNAIDFSIEFLGGNQREMKIIFPSPQGKKWNQKIAFDLSAKKKIVFICGHYKGIDERIIEKYVTDEYSIGDFVLTAGEIPTMLMLDSIIRLVPGTLNNLESALSDSHSDSLLDHPYYTSPREIFGSTVPKVLLSGHHLNIKSWQNSQKKRITKLKRPDLFQEYEKLKKMEKSNEQA
jgi:tRNA (guanine37-N1)-methyltransferase